MKRRYEFTEIDHVSITTKDLAKSVAFYKDFLQLNVAKRPPGIFPFNGEWFALPKGQELHIVEKPNAVYRKRIFFEPKTPPDIHFALRTTNSDDYRMIFEEAIRINKEAGEEVIPYLIEPFAKWQSYLLDPDNNIVEILHYYFHERYRGQTGFTDDGFVLK